MDKEVTAGWRLQGTAGVGAPQLPAPGELGWHEPPEQSHEPQQSAVALHLLHAEAHALVVWRDASATIAGRMSLIVVFVLS